MHCGAKCEDQNRQVLFCKWILLIGWMYFLQSLGRIVHNVKSRLEWVGFILKIKICECGYVSKIFWVWKRCWIRAEAFILCVCVYYSVL